MPSTWPRQICIHSNPPRYHAGYVARTNRPFFPATRKNALTNTNLDAESEVIFRLRSVECFAILRCVFVFKTPRLGMGCCVKVCRRRARQTGISGAPVLLRVLEGRSEREREFSIEFMSGERQRCHDDDEFANDERSCFRFRECVSLTS